MKTQTQTVVKEVEVPVKETKWRKFWQRLDGNRTMILSMIATTVSLCNIPEPYKTIALAILSIAGGKTLYDHVKNGGFKRSVKGVIIE